MCDKGMYDRIMNLEIRKAGTIYEMKKMKTNAYVIRQVKRRNESGGQENVAKLAG